MTDAGSKRGTGRWKLQKALALSAFMATTVLAVMGGRGGVAAPPAEKVDYNHEVHPILSAKCLACHGADPKAIQGGLRLDKRDDAVHKLPSGERAIVPGNAGASELVRRIMATDESQMPPKDSHKTLTQSEKLILRRWIAEGAEYKAHWAFVKPVRPALPGVKFKAWPANSIDTLILARLEKEGLKPSPAADKATLLRRVSLDLCGVPPTPEETDAFLADKSPRAYEKVVDRLLASSRYGECMAMNWMDAARYADSNGYQADYERFQWRWRDWVIDAFNHNMPFDEFTVEQIAGDLLPNATLSQKVATGFNRNHRINTEGGVIAEEWRTETVIDRVETTSAVFLGLTMGCARCHDHKYDPISQKEFYRFYSYFNNVTETGSGVERPVNHPPFLKAPTPAQEVSLAAANAQIAALDRQIAAKEAAAQSAVAAYVERAAQDWDSKLAPGLEARLTLGSLPAGFRVTGKPAFENGYVSGAVKTDGMTFLDKDGLGDFDRETAFSYGCWIKPDALGGVPLSHMDSAKDYRGWDIFLSGDHISAHLIQHWPDDAIKVTTRETVAMGKWLHVFVTYDGSGKANGVHLYLNGKPALLEVNNNNLVGSLRTTAPLRIGGRFGTDGFKGLVDDVRLYRRALLPAEVALLAETDPLRRSLALTPDARTEAQKSILARYALRAGDADYARLTDARVKAEAERTALDNAIPTTMVMDEMPTPRPAFVLLRGQYDQKGEAVTAGLPAAFGTIPAGAPNNRLGLARWIASAENPLTARVAVNRLWEKFFGAGLVPTSEDFGVRADFPSHPELLDWLATEFVRTGWDLKALQKEIVLSATYRQSSRITPSLLVRDPENKLLARGPRFRLPAEVIRDQALAASGLLVEKVGGPSVRPYQPDGVWDELSVYGNLRNYKHDVGDNLHRRSLYTIWKRTSAPPLMTLFDVPGREMCRARRSRTNTPLQALALLNDETFVEASRVLAQRMMVSGATPQARIGYGFRCAVGRRPTENELRILTGGVQKRLARYRAAPDEAAKLVAVGDAPRPAQLNVPELAAYTTIASVILNLDETITKE